MIEIKVDEQLVEEIAIREIKERLSNVNTDKVFWIFDDLCMVTGFSKGHILNTFFDEPEFKKIRRKVGRKHVFPVIETRNFLEKWIQTQPNE